MLLHSKKNPKKPKRQQTEGGAVCVGKKNTTGHIIELWHVVVMVVLQKHYLGEAITISCLEPASTSY